MRVTQRGSKDQPRGCRKSKQRTGRGKCFRRAVPSTLFPGATCEQRDPFPAPSGLAHCKTVSTQGGDDGWLLGTQDPGENQTTVICRGSPPGRQDRDQNFAVEVRGDDVELVS